MHGYSSLEDFYKKNQEQKVRKLKHDARYEEKLKDAGGLKAMYKYPVVSAAINRFITTEKMGYKRSESTKNKKTLYSSRNDIKRFIEKFSINFNEIDMGNMTSLGKKTTRRTLDEWIKSLNSFNDFFIRKLKPDVRPLPKETSQAVSPADGAVLVMTNISNKTEFPIKQAPPMSLAKLLGGEKYAKPFMDGSAFVIRLSEWDYHRFHAPFGGIMNSSRKIRGKYQSVSPIAYESGYQPLNENKKEVALLHNVTGKKALHCAYVMVGAMDVGSIVRTHPSGADIKRGDEVGYFQYGGSTIVLVFPKDAIEPNEDIVTLSKYGQEYHIKMGESIGTLK